MTLQTRAFEFAAKRGWSVAELARRSRISRETLFKLRAGERQPGRKTIEGLLLAFPDLTYRDLFVPIARKVVRGPSSEERDERPAA